MTNQPIPRRPLPLQVDCPRLDVPGPATASSSPTAPPAPGYLESSHPFPTSRIAPARPVLAPPPPDFPPRPAGMPRSPHVTPTSQ